MMMKNTVQTGKNRTGTDMSPIDKKRLIEAAAETVPSMPGDESGIDEVRAEYLEQGATIGSLPPPVSIKGVVQAVKGSQIVVFLDKLGERLAFERTGTRLYEALIGKLDASEPLLGGPSRDQLEKIRDEELAHFEMLREAMLSLGADPTSITPSADVAAVSSMGLLQVIGDPRMNLKQSLEAILIAELVDNDCWRLLIDLASTAGKDDLAKQFEAAMTEEAEHLLNVRTWVNNATLAEARGESAPATTEADLE
jgi:rubrerythrin